MPRKNKTSVRRSPKIKILLDEGFPYRNKLKNLNSYFNVRHIKQDFGFEGLPDKNVYQLASKEGRILVTYNLKDFKPLVNSNQVSVIGVSATLPNQRIDQKLTSLLKKLPTGDFNGKYFSITGETKA